MIGDRWRVSCGLLAARHDCEHEVSVDEFEAKFRHAPALRSRAEA
jgi:hypothetical protein